MRQKQFSGLVHGLPGACCCMYVLNCRYATMYVCVYVCMCVYTVEYVDTEYMHIYMYGCMWQSANRYECIQV